MRACSGGLGLSHKMVRKPAWNLHSCGPRAVQLLHKLLRRATTGVALSSEPMPSLPSIAAACAFRNLIRPGPSAGHRAFMRFRPSSTREFARISDTAPWPSLQPTVIHAPPGGSSPRRQPGLAMPVDRRQVRRLADSPTHSEARDGLSVNSQPSPMPFAIEAARRGYYRSDRRSTRRQAVFSPGTGQPTSINRFRAIESCSRVNRLLHSG